jgi:uroporphyrinogen decarboxylase
MGNLDPGSLLAPRDVLQQRAQHVLDQAGGRPGHVFNLGHGVLPETPVENVAAIVEAVHAFRAGSVPAAVPAGAPAPIPSDAA